MPRHTAKQIKSSFIGRILCNIGAHKWRRVRARFTRQTNTLRPAFFACMRKGCQATKPAPQQLAKEFDRKDLEVAAATGVSFKVDGPEIE